MDISLTRATKDDAEAYLAIEMQVASRFYIIARDVAEAAEEISEGVTYFICERENRVGLISYTKKSDTEARITQLVVLPEYQGRGIGSRALQMVLTELSSLKRIEILTHPEGPALGLYLRAGFIPESRIENYYDTGEPRILLIKNPNSGAS